MKNEWWWTKRRERWFMRGWAVSMIGATAIVWLLTEDFGLAAFTYVAFYLPLLFINSFWLENHKPPATGEIRHEEVHYWKQLRWNGKDWEEVK
jgi:hypothetical protein